MCIIQQLADFADTPHVPGPFVWLVPLLGLLVVAGCFILPREIGQEEEPIVDVQTALPRMMDAAARARSRLRRREMTAPAPSAIEEEAPPVMGAPQLVLGRLGAGDADHAIASDQSG